MKVGFVFDPIYLEHDTNQHAECVSRLTATMDYLQNTGLIQELTQIKARAATVEEIALVHDMRLINHVKATAGEGGGWLDADTVISARSYDAALFAAGGTIKAAEAVMNKEVDSAFALVRPPGHHATRRQSMGFCLFNNIAITTKYIIQKYQLDRVLIVDFDVHQGNGTQEAFETDPRVMYISTHQHPFYPGSGAVEEIGSGKAQGTKINIPLPAGCGDKEYLKVFEEIIIPVARRFSPQLMLVSAGYDIHWSDPLAQMQATTTGVARMVWIINALAGELCQGRLALTLEGGYNLNALATSIKATFDVLLGKKSIEDKLGPPQYARTADITNLITELKAIHKLA